VIKYSVHINVEISKFQIFEHVDTIGALFVWPVPIDLEQITNLNE